MEIDLDTQVLRISQEAQAIAVQIVAIDEGIAKRQGLANELVKLQGQIELLSVLREREDEHVS